MRENRNIPFRDWNIRVSRNHCGHLHICAMDVCNILKRSELLEDGAIARICPTALRISFRKNGRELWSFRPIDMRRLLRMVRKETIIPRDMLDELEAWGNQLLELESDDLHAAARNDIILHFMEGFPVTFRRIGDKLMVNATQITMHFGKIPSEWLRIASTDMLRRESMSRKSSPRVDVDMGRPGWNPPLSYRWSGGSHRKTCPWRNGVVKLLKSCP